MKKFLLFSTIFFITILGLLFIPQKIYANCSTDPTWTLTGSTNYTYSSVLTFTLHNPCSTTSTYSLKQSRPTGFHYQYSGCSKDAVCSVTIAAYSSKTITVTTSRDTGTPGGTYNIVYTAYNSVSSGSKTVPYTVCQTCADASYQCGSFTNNCGKALSCGSSGSCTSSVRYCSNHQCLQRNCTATPVYTPATATMPAGTCGTVTQTCKYTTYSGSTDCKQVACTSKTTFVDNCGSLFCDKTVNKCVACETCSSKNYACGSFTNNCGQLVNCPLCANPLKCDNTVRQCVKQDCNSDPEPVGACTPNSGFCGAGTQNYEYKQFNGSYNCNNVPAPSQSCTATCGTNEICDSTLTCKLQDCNSTEFCPKSCTPNIGTCGGGTITCKFTTLNGSNKCNQVQSGQNACTATCDTANGYECKNNQCVLPPPCGDTLFSDFSPAGVPTGGICMLNRILKTGFNILYIVAIVLSILFAIWGGIDWITSEGDKKKVESARGKLTMAVIGLIVVLVAFILTQTLFKFFGLTL